MAEALVKKSTIAVKKETTYSVDPTVASTDVIRVADINPQDNYDLIELDDIRNTFDELSALRGLESTTGDITLNLRGSGTAGTAPESDPLWECAIGVKNTSTATTAVTGSTSTLLKVADASGISVGDAVRVNTATPQVVWVTAIATNDLTVSPAMNPVPTNGMAVGAGVHYKLSTAELSSFWLAFWRGDITREYYSGNKISALEMDIVTGEAIKPRFTFQGKAMTATASAYNLGTPTYDTPDPIVGLSPVTVDIGGTSVACDRFNFRLTNELYARKDVTSSGISKQIRTGRRVEGSFSVLYEDKTIYDTFKADTESEARIVLGRGSLIAGNIVAIRMPKMRYVSVPVGVDSKLFKYDVSYRAQMTSGEDSVSSVSFL